MQAVVVKNGSDDPDNDQKRIIVISVYKQNKNNNIYQGLWFTSNITNLYSLTKTNSWKRYARGLTKRFTLDGEFNSKVHEYKGKDYLGKYSLGKRNEEGLRETLDEFTKRNN